MANTFLKIPYLKCDVEFGGPILILLGIIYSIWSSRLYHLVLDMPHYLTNDAISIILTVLVMSFSTSYMFYIGLKSSLQKNIMLWLSWIFVEHVCNMVGLVVLLINIYRYRVYDIVICAVLLVCGAYLILNGYNVYKEMSPKEPPSEKSDSEKKDDQMIKV